MADVISIYTLSIGVGDYSLPVFNEIGSMDV